MILQAAEWAQLRTQHQFRARTRQRRRWTVCAGCVASQMLLDDYFSRIVVCFRQFTQNGCHLNEREEIEGIQNGCIWPSISWTYIRRIAIVQCNQTCSSLTSQFDTFLIIGQLNDLQNCFTGWWLFGEFIAATV